MLDTVLLVMPRHAWTMLLIVPVVLVGCATGMRADPTRTPATQPLATEAAAAEVHGLSQPVAEMTGAPSTATSQPEPTPAPTPTPTVVTPPAPLAALVNGEYLFLADYQSKVDHYAEMLVAQGLDPSSEDGETRLAGMRQDVLESMIDFALIEQGAGELGLHLDPERLQKALEEAIVAGGGDTAFEEWLEATGQSRDGYREMLRQALLSQMVLEAVSAGVPEPSGTDAATNLQVAAFEEWLTVQRESATIERFVGD